MCYKAILTYTNILLPIFKCTYNYFRIVKEKKNKLNKSNKFQIKIFLISI